MTVCAVDGCETPKKAREWCGKHYQRFMNHGDAAYERPLSVSAQSLPCTMEGCSTRIHSKGLCCMHYRRKRLHGDPNISWPGRGPKPCTVEGCERDQDSRTYCSKHYQAWQKHGDASYVRSKLRGIAIPHGTLTGYGFHGCRCDKCKTAQASSQRVNQLRQYGLTPADYDRMWSEQGGVCAICRLEGSGTLSGRLMAVDHDHASGRVRGLLCQRCNHAVGLLHDDADRAMTLAAYLLQHADVLGALA